MQCLPKIISLFTISFIIIFAQKTFAQQDEATVNQMLELNWQSKGTYQTNSGLASITTNSEEQLLQGKDAHKFLYLTEGHDGFKPDIVVYRVSGSNQNTQINYTFREIGYLSTDDWDEHIEKNALLQEIKKNTESDNKIKKAGYPKLHVDGWAQEPLLDKTNSLVYWAISAHTDQGEKIINAKALKLARKGFTEITWAGHADLFTSADKSLDPALAAYQYNEGLTYADYKPSIDKLAPFGVGALAYKMITGKTGKASAAAGAGLLAMLAVFAKKLWFLIFIPFAFAWNWLKSIFTGKKDSI